MEVDDALLRDKLAANFRPLGQASDQSEVTALPSTVDCTDCILEDEACFIGVSQHVAQLKKFVTAQASQPEPVLLLGEVGLRCEQVARATHQLSGKPPHSFHAIDARAYNAAAFNELLFSATGLVESGRDGTIFIDEVSKLSLPLLYRFAILVEGLDQRARSSAATGVRLILAASESGPDPAEKNEPSTNVVAVLQPAVFRLKPLRERSEDIPYLVIYLADRIACRLHKSRHNVPPDAMTLLTTYDWPGNIDELETVLESVIAHTPPPEIIEALLPSRIRRTKFGQIPEEGINLFQAVAEYEQGLIAQALRQTGGKQSAAAQLLGLRPQTLNTKLKRSQDTNLDESG
jgi:DNA-binding NtrC family response regulator